MSGREARVAGIGGSINRPYGFQALFFRVGLGATF